jgi:hypothetical protein
VSYAERELFERIARERFREVEIQLTADLHAEVIGETLDHRVARCGYKLLSVQPASGGAIEMRYRTPSGDIETSRMEAE